jgi:hypothetical protein
MSVGVMKTKIFLEEEEPLLTDIRFRASIRGWNNKDHQSRAQSLLNKEDERMLTLLRDDKDILRIPRDCFVYYESMKRRLQIKPIYECRCDGRLKTKRFTRLSHTRRNVYYESMIRKLKIKPIYECRCNGKTTN